jgi:SAM-dependent methyltransferase
MMKLKEYLQNQSFQPGFLGIFINPFYFIRRGLFTEIRRLAPGLTGKLLDFGCGRKPYESLFSVSEYIGVDLEQSGHEHVNSKIDYFYDGKTIPFKDETFDSIFCSEVFEHVFNLDEILPELYRVLKKNGKMLVTVPFCWNEHEIPYDFGRYTSFGIKHLMTKAGFEIITYKKSGNFAQVSWQLWELYFYSIFHAKNKWVNYCCKIIFFLPLNILGVLLLPLFPKNESLFFNNVILVKKSNKK